MESPTPMGAESKRGWTLTFSDLCFSVTDASTGNEKQILRGVSGACKPGRLFALMGASGAGKTTLLDILACNLYTGTLHGEVLVNGRPRDSRAFLKASCYVMQKDVLYASATVRESITTSALLRLPMSMPHETKRERVEDVIKELELESCADTFVGDETLGIKGISGGQKRRLSLAIELVKDPAVIFADEPTSGLDSEVALSIMDALQLLARKQRTVVCTIHQPNSDITDMFDDFMILARGRCVYQGPWASAVGWFGAQGFVTPTYKNPTDYFMSIVKVEEVAFRLADLFEATTTKAIEAPGPAPPAAAAAGDGHVAVAVGGVEVPVQPWHRRTWACLPTSASPPSDRAPAWYQVSILYQRSLRNWLRNPMMLVSEFVQYAFISVFVGLMYHKFTDDTDGLYNRAACIWFAFAIMSFTPSYTAVTSWHSERLLISRELTQRQYGVTPLFVSRLLVTMPAQILQCLVFVAVMYSFVGFQPSADKFFTFWAVLSIFQLISEGLGLLCAIVSRHPTYSVIVLTFLLLLLLSFSGFLMTQIPVYFIWLNKASFLTYAYTALMQSQLEGLWIQDPNNPDATIEAITQLPAVLDNGLTMSQNIGILASQWAAVQLLELGSLHLAQRLGVI